MHLEQKNNKLLIFFYNFIVTQLRRGKKFFILKNQTIRIKILTLLRFLSYIYVIWGYTFYFPEF